MKNQSRRNFCKLCLTAGAGLAPVISLATAQTDEDSKKQESTSEPDYSRIGYCGYRCDICPGRSDDQALRRKMVAGWKKLYGHTMYTEENIPIGEPCAGCKGSGEIADKQCQARPCAREKGIILCTDCAQFPCEKLRPLISDRYHLILNCRNKNVTMEEYKLSAMPFESLPVLIRRMVTLGKLPSWVKEFIG